VRTNDGRAGAKPSHPGNPQSVDPDADRRRGRATGDLL